MIWIASLEVHTSHWLHRSMMTFPQMRFAKIIMTYLNDLKLISLQQIQEDTKESKKAPLGENVTNDAPLTGFIHPKLFNLVASNPSTDINKVPPNDEMLALYDSDEVILLIKKKSI